MFERARKRSKVWNWKIAIRQCNEKWTQQRKTRHKKIVAEVYEWEWQRGSHIFCAFLRHTPTAQSAPLKRSETSPFGRWIGRFFCRAASVSDVSAMALFVRRKLRKLLWPQEKLWFSASVGKTWQQKLFRKLKLISRKTRKSLSGKKVSLRCRLSHRQPKRQQIVPPFKVLFTLLVITSKSPLFALFERPSKRMASVILQSHSEKLFKLTLSMNRFRHCISFDGCVMKTRREGPE